MAVRIHVTASMADQGSLRATFRELLGDGFDNINIESTPPWNFFTTSVWGVDGSKLVEGLQRVGQIGLQATTSDASRWVLALVRPDQPPLSFLHEFHLFGSPCAPDQTVEPPEPEEIDPRLAFLEPDLEPGTQRAWSQFDSIADDYASMGAPIAESFRNRVQGMSYGAALNEFQEYETARLADCLAEARLEFDRQELLDALWWKSTTEREEFADIGNLPRVLLALGLRGSIANFFNSAQDEHASSDAGSADDDAIDDDESEEDKWGQDTFLSITRDAASVHPLTIISGGSVPVGMDELWLLDFFSQAVSVGDFPPVVITVTPPPEVKAAQMLVSNPKSSDVEVRPGDGTWLVGMRLLGIFEPSNWKGVEALVSYLGQELANLLLQPSDGTRLQVDFADVSQPDVCLRFSGATNDGKWHITETYPQLDRQTFEGALLLARQQEASEYELSSEEEAEAIQQAAYRYLNYLDVTRHGNRVRCERDGRGLVAQLILRHRYRHLWNFEPALKHIEEDRQESREEKWQMLRQAAIQRRNCRPCDRKQVIYRGKVSVYWKADVTAWSAMKTIIRVEYDNA